jgi:hypothetical protein
MWVCAGKVGQHMAWGACVHPFGLPRLIDRVPAVENDATILTHAQSVS